MRRQKVDHDNYHNWASILKRGQFIKEYCRYLSEGTASLFIGAGMSAKAGYPTWRELLGEIAEDLEIDLSSEHDLVGVAQWHINKSGKTRTKIAQTIKDNFPDKTEVPPAHRIMARLPVKQIWTTNYDRLIERAWVLQRRRLDVKAVNSDLSVHDKWPESTLYKMHGSVAHPADVVIATDDYELYRTKRAGFLHTLNGHLIGLHFLFLGFSFTDPNIGHLLSIIRESMGEHPTQHFALVKKPTKEGKGKIAEQKFAYARSRHAHWVSDLQRYGIDCVEVDSYDEIDEILGSLESYIARRSVFVSGSYPDGIHTKERYQIEEVATSVGEELGDQKLRLVSGFGLTVGSAVMAGFLKKIYETDYPPLEQNLFLRPFPQVMPDGFDKITFQTRYREDLIQQGGICIFIAGSKFKNGQIVPADGVMEEFAIAQTLGKVLIPVAATGGAAQAIWNLLNENGGANAAKLPPAIFEKLGNVNASAADVINTVKEAVTAAQKL